MNQAETLASHIRSRSDFVIVKSMESYGHMGATLADAILQAGIDYKSVVQPRIQRLLRTYPEATTTSKFARLMLAPGPGTVLEWSGGWKLVTLLELTTVLLSNGIETEADLRSWLEEPANLERLRHIKGIKEKTAHYLQILVGAQSVAVDRHLFRFLAEAGVLTSNYDEAHRIMGGAAKLLGIESSALDHSIWRHMSERKRSAKAKRCKRTMNPKHQLIVSNPANHPVSRAPLSYVVFGSGK
jgi:hypothetical protein